MIEDVLAIAMTRVQHQLRLIVEGFNSKRQEPMANQGRSFSDHQITRIIRLLTSTDMSINDIAERMGCSRSAIVAVNRRYAVRDYSGQRSQWTVQATTEEARSYSPAP
jgi:hypothetical protein